MKIKLPDTSDNQNKYNFVTKKLPLELLFSASEIYHEDSKMHKSDISFYSWISFINISPNIRNIISNPITHFRGYPIIPLTQNHLPTNLSFEDIIKKRRSIRKFSGKSISLERLSKILFLGDGVIEKLEYFDGSTWSLRASPSPGGLYPIDIYCITLNIDNMLPGLYFYNPLQHQLELIQKGILLEPLMDALPGVENDTLKQSCACIILGGIMPRVKFKYGERGYRFALLEAGHICQNLLLAAHAEEVGALPVGGFLDDELNKLLHFDGLNEIVIYLTIIGNIK